MTSPLGAPRKLPRAAELVARLDKLHSLPASVQRILSEANSPKSGAESVGKAIREDPPLAAKVLHLANSGLYRRGEKLTDVRRAVVTLGTTEVQRLVASTALAGFCQAKGGGIDLNKLYVQSLACAMVTDVIVKQSRRLRSEARKTNPFFTAALLHDIGLFAMTAYMPDVVNECFVRARSEGCSLTEIESENIGYGHSQVGGLLLRRWKLGPREIESARHHHAPNRAPMAFSGIVALVHVADAIVSSAMDETDLHLLVGSVSLDAFSQIDLDPRQVMKLVEDCRPAIERAHELAMFLKLNS